MDVDWIAAGVRCFGSRISGRRRLRNDWLVEVDHPRVERFLNAGRRSNAISLPSDGVADKDDQGKDANRTEDQGDVYRVWEHPATIPVGSG